MIVIDTWFRKHRQKPFVMRSGFWPLTGWGGGSKPIRQKKKIRDEDIFSDIFE